MWEHVKFRDRHKSYPEIRLETAVFERSSLQVSTSNRISFIRGLYTQAGGCESNR